MTPTMIWFCQWEWNWVGEEILGGMNLQPAGDCSMQIIWTIGCSMAGGGEIVKWLQCIFMCKSARQKIYWKRAGIFAWMKMNREAMPQMLQVCSQSKIPSPPAALKKPPHNLHIFIDFLRTIGIDSRQSLWFLAGETNTEQWAGCHQGHQAGALRRYTDYPAGDYHDEGLPPSEHHRLLRFVPAQG